MSLPHWSTGCVFIPFHIYFILLENTGWLHKHYKYINLSLPRDPAETLGLDLGKAVLSFTWNISNYMIPGIQIVFHTIYIYEQKFNTVQTATANNPLGPAEGRFCMSVCTCILHSPDVQWKYDWHLSVKKGPMCVLTDMQVLGTIFTFSSQRPEHTQNIQQRSPW